MNQNQKYVLISIVIVLFLQMIFYTPIAFQGYPTDKSPEELHQEGIRIDRNTWTVYTHANLFQNLNSVRIGQFFLYWAIIILVGGTVMLLLQDKKKR